MFAPVKKRLVAAIAMLVMACVYLISDYALLPALNQRELSATIGTKATSPRLRMDDIIYRGYGDWWFRAIVIEEYKLVLFTFPKVACSELKILSRRMMGYDNWDSFDELANHDPAKNGLQYLPYYTLDKANEMMTSDEWTKAVFVREPKGRLLSAYLNKFVTDGWYFIKYCCKDDEYCKERVNNGVYDADSFDYFLHKSSQCDDFHWHPQAEQIDKRWWNEMNFVGKLDTAAADSKHLLKSITSSKTGLSAWEEAGKSGWKGNNAFLVRDEAPHATHADEHMKQYYTPCSELFVEEHWHSEWEREEAFTFEKFRLYDEESYDKECPATFLGMEDLTKND